MRTSPHFSVCNFGVMMVLNGKQISRLFQQQIINRWNIPRKMMEGIPSEPDPVANRPDDFRGQSRRRGVCRGEQRRRRRTPGKRPQPGGAAALRLHPRAGALGWLSRPSGPFPVFLSFFLSFFLIVPSFDSCSTETSSTWTRVWWRSRR